MNKPNLKVIKNLDTNSAEIFLYGIIGDFWYGDDPLTARAFLRQLNSLSEFGEIHIHINSPGGDVFEGIAICNAIKASKKKILTFNDGICASMAAVILASAKDGNRYAAKGSLTMLHSASTFAWGNAEELRETADMLGKHDEILAEIISDALDRPVAEITSEYFDGSDHWLTAKEAAAIGLIAISNYTADEMPDNATAMKFDRVAAFYKPQIKNENMFGKDKFKSLSALAKIAVADITAEMVNAINEEIEAEKIPGVTLVMDSVLESVTAESEKVPGLTTKVNDLQIKLDAENKKVLDLTAEVDRLGKELGKPEDEGADPVTKEKEKTIGDGSSPKDSFETSVDRELKKALGN